MAHLPGEGEDENFYDMITISPPPMEFGDFVPSSSNGAKPQRGQNDSGNRYPGQEYASFLEQNPSFLTHHEKSQRSPHAGFAPDHHEDLQLDSAMFANPNQNNIKAESPDLLSPTSIGNGYRTRHSEFMTAQSLYSDAGSNAQSLFHDAASHFSGAAEPPAAYYEQSTQHLDTFNQEIALGESISSTNLADMNLGNQAVYADSMYSRGGHNGQKQYHQDFHSGVGVNLGEDPSFQQDSWRYNYAPQIPADAFPAFQNQYENYSNKLTENNLSSYNGKMENSDAKVTISIHQAPELVAAHTPSLFSNSSHNSSPGNKQNYTGNQLQPPGQTQRSRSPSLSNVPPSPTQSWQQTASPSLSANLPSPGASVYSDMEGDSFLRPDDYQNMRRGRQSAHLQKVRSRSHSRSNSRSGSVSVHSTSDYYESGSDVDPNDVHEDADEAKAAREKMLELASSASVSKRTQIHPSSYACHLCEKKFTRPYNLKSHLRTHTDERPFICNICGKAFARQHDRKRHEELHSGEKKYQCRGILRDGTPFGCGRKFARADALRRHFQTESGRECIKLLVEEDAREQSDNTGTLSSGIQLPDGEFMNPNAPEIPVLSVSPPQ